MEKIKVTERAIFARLNRRLAKDGQEVHRYRRGHERNGRYYVTQGEKVIEDNRISLESLAKKYGILKPFETL